MTATRTVYPAGDYVVWYTLTADHIEVGTRHDATGEPVARLTRQFRHRDARLAGRIATVIITALESGADPVAAREAVVTFLSRLVSQVEAANRWAPQATMELIQLRAWFAAPDPTEVPAGVPADPTLDAAVRDAWGEQVARMAAARTAVRASATRLYLRAVL